MKSMLRLFDHIEKMNEDQIIKQIFTTKKKMNESRGRGRPKES